MFHSQSVRWETGSRWYEAMIIRDLLGDWTVLRRWGSRFTGRGGFMVEPVAGYLQACQRMERIDQERRRRPVPYRRVDGRSG